MSLFPIVVDSEWALLIFLFFQIIDEKSLIKKYQREISCLKEELDQFKRGVVVGVNHEDIMVLKQQVPYM